MDIMKALRRYISDEYENKLEKKVDTSKWKIRYKPLSVLRGGKVILHMCDRKVHVCTSRAMGSSAVTQCCVLQHDCGGDMTSHSMTVLHASAVAGKECSRAERDCVSFCRFPTDIPYQTNGSDCGVFALQYAEHVSRDAAFEFDQQDMPFLRIKVASDIMSLTIV